LFHFKFHLNFNDLSLNWAGVILIYLFKKMGAQVSYFLKSSRINKSLKMNIFYEYSRLNYLDLKVANITKKLKLIDSLWNLGLYFLELFKKELIWAPIWVFNVRTEVIFTNKSITFFVFNCKSYFYTHIIIQIKITSFIIFGLFIIKF